MDCAHDDPSISGASPYLSRFVFFEGLGLLGFCSFFLMGFSETFLVF